MPDKDIGAGGVNGGVFDLMYDNDECQQAIAKQYPSAVFEDASDIVHEERFSVQIDDVSPDEYHKWLVMSGGAAASLGINMLLMGLNKGDKEKIVGWVKDKKANERKLHERPTSKTLRLMP